MDTVAVTRMIRQMQQAGASADEIRQMIAENRRRGSATRAPHR
jgi:DNA-binding transcriptional MerR regulator